MVLTGGNSPLAEELSTTIRLLHKLGKEQVTAVITETMRHTTERIEQLRAIGTAQSHKTIEELELLLLQLGTSIIVNTI